MTPYTALPLLCTEHRIEPYDPWMRHSGLPYNADGGPIAKAAVRTTRGHMKLRIALLLALGLITAACSGNVFDLEVGQCFNDPDSFDEVANVDIVECSEPHDNEVYHVFDLADGDYPGLSAVETDAADGCLSAFEPFVQRDYQTSELDIRYLYPTPDTWDNGDREIVCALFDLSGNQMTGSAQGSGR